MKWLIVGLVIGSANIQNILFLEKYYAKNSPKIYFYLNKNEIPCINKYMPNNFDAIKNGYYPNSCNL